MNPTVGIGLGAEFVRTPAHRGLWWALGGRGDRPCGLAESTAEESPVNKVVARYADGRVVKGTTVDFVPTKDLFHVSVADAADGTPSVEIHTKDLKALFFVKDFAGNPPHVQRNEFDSSHAPVGRRIRVRFKDGEVLVGTTTGYQAGRAGFFLIPADASSNMERCYVVTASTIEVGFL